ncbi:hypothetical protein BLNAU_264 [Blattamonas nauphoetae]|uniref:Uncharacterized protein n=1 Tax=Blattamonas nauphoetae TaxID=2049346 RepID=A0ABQ9YMI2_9EUKA|nr:hypothetical protein BLNAU_264 [Blattamonas nauphoetae]
MRDLYQVTDLKKLLDTPPPEISTAEDRNHVIQTGGANLRSNDRPDIILPPVPDGSGRMGRTRRQRTDDSPPQWTIPTERPSTRLAVFLSLFDTHLPLLSPHNLFSNHSHNPLEPNHDQPPSIMALRIIIFTSTSHTKTDPSHLTSTNSPTNADEKVETEDNHPLRFLPAQSSFICEQFLPTSSTSSLGSGTDLHLSPSPNLNSQTEIDRARIEGSSKVEREAELVDLNKQKVMEEAQERLRVELSMLTPDNAPRTAPISATGAGQTQAASLQFAASLFHFWRVLTRTDHIPFPSRTLRRPPRINCQNRPKVSSQIRAWKARLELTKCGAGGENESEDYFHDIDDMKEAQRQAVKERLKKEKDTLLWTKLCNTRTGSKRKTRSFWVSRLRNLHNTVVPNSPPSQPEAVTTKGEEKQRKEEEKGSRREAMTVNGGGGEKTRDSDWRAKRRYGGRKRSCLEGWKRKEDTERRNVSKS